MRVGRSASRLDSRVASSLDSKIDASVDLSSSELKNGIESGGFEN